MKFKKPRFWDYKKPNFYAYLLFPISLLIKLINKFKINKIKKNFKIKTICVGNFYVGGTGKTSLCIEIKEILERKNIKTCFVKKFYKSQFDEQKILKKNGSIFLSKNRAKAIEKAEAENYDFAVIDDGLQDKSINYDVSIVCFNNNNWIGNGLTIPSGPLRENIENLKNYKHVFLNGNLENLDNLKKEIFRINPSVNIHLGKYEAININEFKKENNYLVFSGIGNHHTFVSMLKNYGLVVLEDYEFPDHYTYSKKDLKLIINQAKKLKCEIITTEKDYFRFENLKLNEIKFIKSKLKIIDEEKFIKSIT